MEMQDPVILLWEISATLEIGNMDSAVDKKIFPLSSLVRNGFQENSACRPRCVAEGRVVVKVSECLCHFLRRSSHYVR